MSRQAIQDSVDFFVLAASELTSSIDDLRIADGSRSWVRGAGVQHGLWCLDQMNVLPLSPSVVATMSAIGRWIYFGSGFVPPPPPAAGFPYEFIFRPTEPFPSGNVYASWPLLVAAAAATLGSKLVYFDDTLAPCVIPVGFWDFGSPTTFIGSDGLPSGSGGPNTTPLTIDDGATLANVFEFRSLDITSDTTTAVILTPLFGAHYYLSGTTRLTQADPAGTFLASGTGFVFSPVVVTLKEFAEIATGAGPALSVTAVGANISVVALDDSNVQTDTIASVVGGFPTGSIVDSAFISTGQVGVPGGILTVALLSIAARVSYDDTLVLPLLGASEVQAAIDALKGMSSPWTRTLTVTALNAADTEVNPFGDDASAIGKPSLRWASVTVGSAGFSVSLGGVNPTSILGSAQLEMGSGGATAPDTRVRRVAPSGTPQVAIDDNAGGPVHVLPATDGISKLGTRSIADGGADAVSVRWEEVNTVTINTGDLNLIDEKKDAHWTIIEERDRILVLNRKTGKRYAMALTPIDNE